MHICLFGGAFDPPHLGHQQVAKSLLEQKICDEVWYLPVKNHHFEKKMSDLKHRLAMLKFITQGHAHTRVELYETKQEGINYTYRTMIALSAQYPNHQFSFVIGSDNLKGFHRWLEVHPHLLEFPFFVYPRKGFPFEPWFTGMIKLEHVPEVTVSSTQVREKIVAGQSITGLVDERVEQYIKENKLYL